MPQIDCPNCGAPIDSSERACPYCGAAIKASSPVPPQAQMDRDLFSGNISLNANDADEFRAVREQIARGNKIEAIKIYREKTGVGLKEAKDAVEAMEAGRPVIVQQVTLVGASAAAGAGFASSAEMMDEVKRQLRKGNKIEAIKTYREYFNVGLKEAKDAVDAVETELKFQSEPVLDTEPPAFARPDAPTVEPVVSPNPFDEPKAPAWRKWLIGCGVALLVLCVCTIVPLALFGLRVFGNGS
jgi:ribosomal protein L7/L12